MHARRGGIVLAALVCSWSALGGVPRDEAYERGLRAQLEQVDPALVATFDAATRALDSDALEEAVKGFDAVAAKAPRFDAAHRRACTALAQLKRYPEADERCHRALGLDASFTNQLALASLRALRGEGNDEVELQAWLRRAVSEQPRGSENWGYAKALDCSRNFRRAEAEQKTAPDSRQASDDWAQARACADDWVAGAPEDPRANYLTIETAAMRGEWQTAFERLEKARPILPPGEYERIHGLLNESQPMLHRWGPLALKVFGLWLAVLALLVTLGTSLSWLTLRTARTLSTSREADTSPGARGLRGLYRAVIAVGSVFYYLSLPLVAAVVVAAGGGFISLWFALGQVPIKLVVLAGFLVLATLFAILKSLFVRVEDQDPGEKLDWAQAPKLRRLVEEVAGRSGTRPIDNVYLTPGTELAVFERGGLRARLAGTTERCLILGVGVLDGFAVGPFRSVLAHEYGHFSNQDTAGGGLALWARRSLMKMGHALAMSGAAAWYNPAWLFFRGYFAVFLRISQGASRLQEVLADRASQFLYGSKSFAEGYSHVLRQTVAFDAHSSATLKEVIEGKRGLQNLYRFAPAHPPSQAALDQEHTALLERAPSPYDSHPASKDRLAWAAELALPGRPQPDDADQVWSLFESRDALERRMTEVVRLNVALNHDIAIPAEG